MGQVGKIFSLVVGCCFCFSWVQAQVVNYALRLSGSDYVTCGQVSEVDGKMNMPFSF